MKIKMLLISSFILWCMFILSVFSQSVLAEPLNSFSIPIGRSPFQLALDGTHVVHMDEAGKTVYDIYAPSSDNLLSSLVSDVATHREPKAFVEDCVGGTMYVAGPGVGINNTEVHRFIPAENGLTYTGEALSQRYMDSETAQFISCGNLLGKYFIGNPSHLLTQAYLEPEYPSGGSYSDLFGPVGYDVDSGDILVLGRMNFVPTLRLLRPDTGPVPNLMTVLYTETLSDTWGVPLGVGYGDFNNDGAAEAIVNFPNSIVAFSMITDGDILWELPKEPSQDKLFYVSQVCQQKAVVLADSSGNFEVITAFGRKDLGGATIYSGPQNNFQVYNNIMAYTAENEDIGMYGLRIPCSGLVPPTPTYDIFLPVVVN